MSTINNRLVETQLKLALASVRNAVKILKDTDNPELQITDTISRLEEVIKNLEQMHLNAYFKSPENLKKFLQDIFY